MSVGDRAEKADMEAGRPQRTMVELQPRKWSSLSNSYVAACVSATICGLILVVLIRDRDVEPAATASGVTAEQPPRDPDITMTEVAPGVFHLDFEGYYCSDAPCLKAAFTLIREHAPGNRIVNVESVGEYGSPTALLVITAPIPPQ